MIFFFFPIKCSTCYKASQEGDQLQQESGELDPSPEELGVPEPSVWPDGLPGLHHQQSADASDQFPVCRAIRSVCSSAGGKIVKLLKCKQLTR